MADFDINSLLKGIERGNRYSLSRAITLLESTQPSHRELAIQLLESLPKPATRSIRIAISGPPGVGKSTFIEHWGTWLTHQNQKLAILTIDPSSGLTGGSILGDKTRMENLSTNDAAYIRPSPSGSSLGGITAKTFETILLCEAAGFPVVLIETVGVGQSEIAASMIADVFMVMIPPGGGDELQGIKKGIIERADILVVNKSDGRLKEDARITAGQYRATVHSARSRPDQWQVPVVRASAVEGKGFQRIWEAINEYIDIINLEGKRTRAQFFVMEENIKTELYLRFKSDEKIQKAKTMIQKKVASGSLHYLRASQELLDELFA